MDKIFVDFLDVLAQFLLKQVNRNYIIITKKRMYELPQELPTDLLRLRILEN